MVAMAAVGERRLRAQCERAARAASAADAEAVVALLD
jgi:hypothetical protein